MRPAAAGVTRALCLLAVLAAVGLLPWLSGRDPALTVLRARSAEQEPTREALDAIRRDLGLDAGPLSLLGSWAADLAHGDLGTSWVSGTDVLPSVLAGLQVSLALMGAALAVAVLLAVVLVAPVLVRGRASAGAGAAMSAAVPEFLLATVGLLVCGVWLGWLPTSGWAGPEYMVLPAVALGVPAGGLLGRLVADALPAVLDERWVELWRGAGVSRARIASAALCRVLPPLVPQFGIAAVGLTGGAVAVESVFAVPGIGRTALGAARSQDLPLLQGSVLALLLLGLVTGAAAALVRRRLLGPALRDASLALPQARPVRIHPAFPLTLAGVLLTPIGWGLLRDPYAIDTAARLAPPSAHAAALVQEVRASSFLLAQRAIGASPWWILTRHVLPSVAAPVARHALLRLPGIALALASLGFLGLGAQPPAPEWGLLLEESRAYVERAPWAALAPAVALALLAGLAVSGAAYAQGRGMKNMKKETPVGV
ncbi:ABC transporter permease subunit [Streptomyces sp. NPDC096132]|uniref:ABC transporter permease subunit n=1 Tax=Streptomyces sp. NPDC096132 TaxID=3366075 RepID=UPI00381DF8DF